MHIHREHKDSQKHMLSTRGATLKNAIRREHSDSQQHMRSTRQLFLKSVHPSSTQRQLTTHAFNQGGYFDQTATRQRQPTAHASNQEGYFEISSTFKHNATANYTSFQPKGLS
jgi:hypothetical protein